MGCLFIWSFEVITDLSPDENNENVLRMLGVLDCHNANVSNKRCVVTSQGSERPRAEWKLCSFHSNIFKPNCKNTTISHRMTASNGIQSMDHLKGKDNVCSYGYVCLCRCSYWRFSYRRWTISERIVELFEHSRAAASYLIHLFFFIYAPAY